MPVDAFCNDCETTYRVSRKMEGKLVKCPACNRAIRVPLTSPSLASIAADLAAGRPPARPAPPAAKPKSVVKPAAARAPAPAAKAPAKPPAKPARPAPAKPRKPGPPTEPESDEGAYDLADLRALAAAETAAQAIEERVYIPAPVVEAPAPRDSRRFVRITNSGPESEPRGNVDIVALVVGSPMFYCQLLAVALVAIGFFNQPLLLAIGILALLPLLLISFMVGYLKALLLTAKRWPVVGVTGIVLPLYLPIVVCLQGAFPETLFTLKQYHVPAVVDLLTIVTAIGFIVHTVIDFRTMAKALVFGGYFLMDIFIIMGVGAIFMHVINVARNSPH